MQRRVTLGKSDPPWVTPAGCDRSTGKRDRQKGTQLNSLVCSPVSHSAIRAMHLAALVTYSLNRYNLQGWKPVKKAILLADRLYVPQVP